MNGKITCLVPLILLLAAANMVCAVEIKVDFGSSGTLGDNDPPDAMGPWTEKTTTSGSFTIDDITFQVSNGNLTVGPKVRYWEASGDNLTEDSFCQEDPGSGGWYQIQITSLDEGAEYIMRSYHNSALPLFLAHVSGVNYNFPLTTVIFAVTS